MITEYPTWKLFAVALIVWMNKFCFHKYSSFAEHRFLHITICFHHVSSSSICIVRQICILFCFVVNNRINIWTAATVADEYVSEWLLPLSVFTRFVSDRLRHHFICCVYFICFIQYDYRTVNTGMCIYVSCRTTLYRVEEIHSHVHLFVLHLHFIWSLSLNRNTSYIYFHQTPAEERLSNYNEMAHKEITSLSEIRRLINISLKAKILFVSKFENGILWGVLMADGRFVQHGRLWILPSAQNHSRFSV